MARIATYAFIDLETTGLPREELNKTKITELSIIAVKRQHVLDTRPGASPRVQHKVTLCFNPARPIQPASTDVTGLSNELLEYETKFDINVYNVLNTFLNTLTKPVCLIAQNGLQFDFPILKAHLDKLKVSFSEDLMVADCYHAFYDIMEAIKRQEVIDVKDLSNSAKDSTSLQLDNISVKQNTTIHNEESLLPATKDISLQSTNEMTPRRLIINTVPNTPRKEHKSAHRQKRRVCRKFPWSEGAKPTEKYKLKCIYERLLNRPGIEAHRAENDCIMALECSVALSKEFVVWVDENHMPFTDVKAMTIGVPLGQ